MDKWSENEIKGISLVARIIAEKTKKNPPPKREPPKDPPKKKEPPDKRPPKKEPPKEPPKKILLL
ncbi:MAG TPA: hypothetical protein VHT73_14720 [Thermodesulfobacteriota bacterium]|nr:hypothetical protein [Thermodesulfobacteriota bacterium]